MDPAPRLSPLTTRRGEARIAQTADYYVIPAPVPFSVALFTCPCGAKAVEYDVKRDEPAGWMTADDGSHRWAPCAREIVATRGVLTNI